MEIIIVINFIINTLCLAKGRRLPLSFHLNSFYIGDIRPNLISSSASFPRHCVQHQHPYKQSECEGGAGYSLEADVLPEVHADVHLQSQHRVTLRTHLKRVKHLICKFASSTLSVLAAAHPPPLSILSPTSSFHPLPSPLSLLSSPPLPLLSPLLSPSSPPPLSILPPLHPLSILSPLPLSLLPTNQLPPFVPRTLRTARSQSRYL